MQKILFSEKVGGMTPFCVAPGLSALATATLSKVLEFEQMENGIL